MNNEINFMVGGEAGQGVQTVGFLLTKALTLYGYHVFADQDYESRVRGGHNFFRVRARQIPVYAIAEKVDILIAFNRESIELHREELSPAGIIVYDGEAVKDLKENNAISIPADKISTETTGESQAANTVLLAAGLALCGYEAETLKELLRNYFKGDSGEKNCRAAEAAYEYVKSQASAKSGYKLKSIGSKSRMTISGNEAMALGAIAAGCKFVSAYPMTPTTSVIEYIASKSEDLGIVVVAAEDEISAINMINGAGYAGVRALTATSGGGFCLMVEGLGLAGITETPIVVIEGQRPGPAIGLPTRQEQGDLEFVLHASHGEFPRVVLAPATIEECFWAVHKAFNIAEKYQLPVIVMTDHHLGTSYSAVDRFDTTQIKIDRGLMYSGDGKEYKRHRFTTDGVSPRAFPGQAGTLVLTDSDEHDETGHLTEDPVLKTQMTNKRLGKLVPASRDVTPPTLYGAPEPEVILVGWGSSFGAIREAVETLNENGGQFAHLHLTGIWPFPKEEFSRLVADCGNVYVVEGNATGQLAGLIRRETCMTAKGSILRYDGRPLTPVEIMTAVKEGK